MQKLSAVLATFNEEENIARCLAAIEDLADEIVIVDGSSTDKTRDIVKKFGARVIKTTNKPNFHINKQMGIEACKFDWILQLDADEVVSEELAKEIREILKNSESRIKNIEPGKKNPDSKFQIPDSNINGYWMPRKNYFLGRFLMKGGQYPDYTVRFYKNGKGRLPMKDVHEQAVIEGKVGYLKEALLHYPYKDFAFYYKKWMRYNYFMSDQIREEMRDKSLISKIYYGVAYLLAKPAHWMLTAYGRHKGFMDGWQGFVFALFSALRFPVSYILYLREQ